MSTPTARARAEHLREQLYAISSATSATREAQVVAILAYADEIRREEMERIVKILRDLQVPHNDERSLALVPLADVERIVAAIRQSDDQADGTEE